MKQSKILASACRRKILTALSEKKQTSMMKLVRAANSNYNEVNRNLHVLEQEGVVTQQHAGHNRIISLNYENEKTLVPLKLLKIINGSVDLKQFRRKLKRAIENSKEAGNCAKTQT